MMKENDTLGQGNSMIKRSRKRVLNIFWEKWISTCIIGLKKKSGIIMGIQLQNKLAPDCNFQFIFNWKIFETENDPLKGNNIDYLISIESLEHPGRNKPCEGEYYPRVRADFPVHVRTTQSTKVGHYKMKKVRVKIRKSSQTPNCKHLKFLKKELCSKGDKDFTVSQSWGTGAEGKVKVEE